MATKPTLNDLMYEYYFGLEGTPVTAAGAPTSPVATAGAGFVSVAFVAPASTGSEPILGYEVTLSNGRVASGTSSPIVVLTPGGSAVTATVKAFNGALGVASAASNSVTPTAVATVPGAPTSPVATAGNEQVSIAFTAPASNGGSAILDYRLTLSNGQVVGGASSPIVIPAPNTFPVTATVAARNVLGYGPESVTSNSVTPAKSSTPPPLPNILSNMRLVNRSNLTESGNQTSGWSYVATTGVDYGGFGASTAYIPAGEEGYYELVQPAAGVSIAVLALKTTSVAQGIANFAYACQPLLPGQGSQRYIQFVNGGAGTAPNGATVLTAPNQRYRVGTRINGANLDGYIEVSSDGGTSYVLVHTWPSIPKVDYFCGVATGTSANNVMGLKQFNAADWVNSELIFDGDSLSASYPTTAAQRVPQLVHTSAPVLSQSGFSMLAIGGQTTQQMIDNAADVDAAILVGRTNVLVVWAGTNGMLDGAAVQAERMRVYTAGRFTAAANKGARLRIVLVGSLPRHETSAISIDERNNRLVAYNQLLANNWAAWGCSGYVDTRPVGGPFDLPDWSTARFTRTETLPMWAPEDAPGVYTHLSVAGAAYIRPLISAVISSIQ